MRTVRKDNEGKRRSRRVLSAAAVLIAASMVAPVGTVMAEESEAFEIDEIDLPQAGSFINIGNDAIVLPTEEVTVAESDKVALDDLDISIKPEDYVSIRQDEDGFVYVYNMYDDSIPYVIIGKYDIAYDKMADAFTRMMQDNYDTLDVDSVEEGVTIGDREYTKVIYNYAIAGGYKVTDTRYFCSINNHSYMFGMKEVESLDSLVGEDYIQAIMKSAEVLAGGYSDYAYHVDSENAVLMKEGEEKEDDYDLIALDSLGASIRLGKGEYCSIQEDEDGFVSVYTKNDDSIPYVILGTYDVAYDKVAKEFTSMMAHQYSDLETLVQAGTVQIEDREFTTNVYNYHVAAYLADDVRYFYDMDGTTFMIGSKEVSDLDLTLEEGFFRSVAMSLEPIKEDLEYDYHVDYNNPLMLGEENEPEVSLPQHSKTGFENSKAPFDGTWVEFEDGYKLFLPADWSEYEPTTEQQNNGVLYIAGDASITQETPYISVSFAYDDTMETLEDFSDFLEMSGYRVESVENVNDIECVRYAQYDGTLRGELFLYPGDDMEGFIFTVVANNYQSAEEYIDYILDSLQLTD